MSTYCNTIYGAVQDNNPFHGLVSGEILPMTAPNRNGRAFVSGRGYDIL